VAGNEPMPGEPNYFAAPQAVSETHTPAPGWRGASVHVALHGLVWALLFFVLLLIVPKFRSALAGSATPLPPLTMLVLHGAMLARQYWYLATLGVHLVLIIDYWCLVALSADLRLRGLRHTWLLGMLALPVILLAIITLGLMLPAVL